jgi:hypothetical protein
MVRARCIVALAATIRPRKNDVPHSWVDVLARHVRPRSKPSQENGVIAEFRRLNEVRLWPRRTSDLTFSVHEGEWVTMFHRQLCKATIALGFALSSLVGGSSAARADKIGTTRLDAFVFQSWHMRHKEWSHWPGRFHESGLAPELPASGVAAGYDDQKDGGWLCGEQFNTVYRGGVRFDLNQKGPDFPDGLAKADVIAVRTRSWY